MKTDEESWPKIRPFRGDALDRAADVLATVLWNVVDAAALLIGASWLHDGFPSLTVRTYLGTFLVLIVIRQTLKASR